MVSRAEWLSSLSEEEALALLHSDFATFALAMFKVVNPGRELIWAGYLGPLLSWLEDIAHGRRTRLIITMPPRFLKSFAVSAALPAYVLGHYPHEEVMCVSYSHDLAKTFARQSQTIMPSPLYRDLFGDILAGSRQPLSELRTTKNGVRRATSIDGTATGHGADLLAFDDPQKAGETLSEAIRRSTNESYEQTFYSRGNDPGKKRIVIVMQRLHEDDFVGHVQGLGEDWDILKLPAIAEENQALNYATPFGPRTYRRREGVSLHPQRVTRAELDKTRRTVGEAIWATQHQQRPAPMGGGVVKIEWFRRYDPANRPPLTAIFQSWDTASTVSQTSAWSVCTTWGRHGKDLYLIAVRRVRMIFPDLKREIVIQARLHNAKVVLIEEAGSGIQLIQQLRRENFGEARAVKVTADKQTRMETQTAFIENGFVYIPREAPWLAEYLHELALFPRSKFLDQCDSTSQALHYAQAGGSDAWIRLMDEYYAKKKREGTS